MLTSVLTVAVWVISLGTAALAVLYTVKNLRSDLVLLGAATLMELVWFAECAVLAVQHATGTPMSDPITLYGYLLTGLALPLGAGYLSIIERTRWGSASIGVAALVLAVLELRLPQIWPGGFS
ncbi:hypothetical protein [Devriesea agamarum]|uniref:hypothetical protein n=1 Tax=Devriesea agamarum TaxID=472569 RepID=UPI001E599945|nr:hypothetical protein [Devriesea agamarum]